MKKLYVFGCSFSTPYMVKEEDSWMDLLADKLNAKLVRHSEMALDHKECFDRLQNATRKFSQGDYVVYQFTAGIREGFMIGDQYYSSAGLGATLEDTIEVFNKYGGGRDKYPMSDDHLINLIEWTNYWGHHTAYYKYHMVKNHMELLKYKVNYAFLHLDNAFQKWIDDKTVLFDGEPSIIDWNRNNQGGLSHTGRGLETQDMHPNEKAHRHIFNELHKKFNKR